MKQLFLILISLFVLGSCSKGDTWTPEDDIEDFLTKNPYGVVFENATEGDLYLKCTGLAATTFPVLKQGKESDTFRGPQSEITVEYTGEGTHYTTMKKNITLAKEKVSRIVLTYP